MGRSSNGFESSFGVECKCGGLTHYKKYAKMQGHKFDIVFCTLAILQQNGRFLCKKLF
jgi:hypothetical protein